MKITKLAGDLAWPEGPSPLGDGGIAFVETYRSQSVRLDSGKRSISVRLCRRGP